MGQVTIIDACECLPEYPYLRHQLSTIQNSLGHFGIGFTLVRLNSFLGNGFFLVLNKRVGTFPTRRYFKINLFEDSSLSLSWFNKFQEREVKIRYDYFFKSSVRALTLILKKELDKE